MGLPPSGRCSAGPSNPAARAPNPDPSRWRLLDVKQFDDAHVVTARYLDCTNFEGVKVMVFRGAWNPARRELDPHFSEADDSPMARFPPTAEGVRWAVDMARAVGNRTRP